MSFFELVTTLRRRHIIVTGREVLATNELTGIVERRPLITLHWQAKYVRQETVRALERQVKRHQHAIIEMIMQQGRYQNDLETIGTR